MESEARSGLRLSSVLRLRLHGSRLLTEYIHCLQVAQSLDHIGLCGTVPLQPHSSIIIMPRGPQLMPRLPQDNLSGRRQCQKQQLCLHFTRSNSKRYELPRYSSHSLIGWKDAGESCHVIGFFLPHVSTRSKDIGTPHCLHARLGKREAENPGKQEYYAA